MPRTVLHVGPHKTGTSYLQAALCERRPQLLEAGWLYPGPNPSHERPFVSFLKSNGLLEAELPPEYAKWWEPFIDTISRWDGSLLLSAETLGGLSAEALARVIEALGRDNLEIVFTDRDLGRMLPSRLQEHYKGGDTFSANELYQMLVDQRPDKAGGIWLIFSTVGMIKRWSARPEVRSVSVAICPPRGSVDNLWTRFVAAADLPLDADDVPGVSAAGSANRSLSAPQARLLRYVNLAVKESDELTVADRSRLRQQIWMRWMNSEGSGGPSLRVHDAHWRGIVTQWAQEDIDQLAASDVRIFGELGELVPDFGGNVELDTPDPTQCSADELPHMTAAVEAILAAYRSPPQPAPPLTLRRVTAGVKRRIRRTGRQR